MKRRSRALAVSVLAGSAAFAVPAGAQQLAQSAVESAVITKGATTAVQPKPASVSNRGGAATAATSAPPAFDSQSPAQVGPAMNLSIGKSTLLRLPAAIDRISVGNPAVADVTLISARELYLLGKTFGSTNIIMWRKGGATTIIDVDVTLDSNALQQRLRQLLPAEKEIVVGTAADAVVLSGNVSSALQADYAVSVVEAFVRSHSRGMTLPVTAGNVPVAPGQLISVGTAMQQAAVGNLQSLPRVVNMMRIAEPQQVMLEVKVAEISKNLLEKIGVGIDAARVNGDWRYSIISNFLSEGSGILGALSRTGNAVQVDALKQDGLIRVLAEPNIVAISGQEGSFLAGGKIFIPVARANVATGGVPYITLEEKDFGVGLKFTPTVLDGGRINLKVAPEVSEPVQTGNPFTAVGGVTAILPSFAVRRAQTTVQLMDGQSFAIAGLIKNNVTEAIKRFPVLGEVPILGALFRSTEFKSELTELMFIVTPRLVKPLPANHALPTDNFVPPSRAEFWLGGKLEGSGNAAVPPTEWQRQQMLNQQQPAASAQGSAPAATPADTPPPPATSAGQGGFQLK